MSDEQTKFEILRDLQAEINAMDNLAFYYATRALAKEVALRELMQSWSAQMEDNEDVKDPSVGAITMVREIIKDMNGAALTIDQFYDRCIEKFPAIVKDRSHFASACWKLTKAGVLIQSGKEYRRSHA